MALPRTLRPIITICGATGVGKSKLAVELALNLAKRFDTHGWKGGVVVNADSMQVYKGFNTITNKIPFGEREGVDHVLMGIKEPTEQYVVGQWVHDATQAINDAHLSKKVPVVVGGTAYYIQHLAFPGRLAVEPEQVTDSLSPPPPTRPPPSDMLLSALSQITPDMRELFDALPEIPPSAAEEPGAALSLYNLLHALDPDVASRWHWRDTRKVLRNLQIMRDTGKRVSDIFKAQSSMTPAPKYDTLCFWLYAEPEELRRRLDIRTDAMLQDNLLDDVRELRSLMLPSKDSSAYFTAGVYQSIGFREFHKYLSDPSPSEKKYQVAVEEMKTANHQYAKRQTSWIRNKLVPAVQASKAAEGGRRAEVYLLDTTEPGEWTSAVRDLAISLMEAFLNCEPLPDPLTLSSAAKTMLSVPERATDPTAVLLARRKIICPVCTKDESQPVMIEQGREWDAHARSKVHKYLLAKCVGNRHVSATGSGTG
ncbi:tRNA isopentenyltransferase [Lactarius akahatsu]|uniref:tRNA isopentenyltransferase n=1 Tax=Lactarius akahatsu TaxID=416441 RepID=A0AAD4QGU3_9AGAM|nr:tRNA isopentenyltransferase [Lactarius akahatsu]